MGVQDLRSYVVYGDKDEDFAGLARSGYGIPYDIGTESNRPLAQEMADVIVAGLRNSRATVKIVNLSPKMGRADVIRTMTKCIEAVLKPEAAAALADLRQRTGRTYSAIIEGLLLAERARDLRRTG